MKSLFPSLRDCFEYLRRKRWKDGVKCLYCGSPYIWSDGFTPKGARKYQCQECGEYFNDLTDTIFESHSFPIGEMFYILKEAEVKSSHQIADELGRDYELVLNFVHEEASRYALTLEGIAEIEKVKKHRIVNHGRRDWARGEKTHVNGCDEQECFLQSLFKEV